MRFLTATVLTAAVALAGCTSDGTPASPGDLGSVGNFVQPPVPPSEVPQAAQNEAPIKPPAPKTKPVTSKPKQSAVAVTPPPEQKASAEPQSPPESAAPSVLSGAASILSTGSFGYQR
jgi:outer membrane biosynthesis protein TonB